MDRSSNTRNTDNYLDLSKLQSLTLTKRQLCDIELLLNGGFAPLNGFMKKSDYECVVENMRLENGELWPIPITLDVSEIIVQPLKCGDSICLRDEEGFAIATLKISDIWLPDKKLEAIKVYGTLDETHPGVNFLLNKVENYYLGGDLKKISLPSHYDYEHLRDTPASLKAKFDDKGWNKVVAFQTRNPLHKAHKEITQRAAEESGTKLLIHPIVGLTKPGDVDHYTRVRCYEKILSKYPDNSTMLSLLPLAMRMAGPREAIWHALIRKNYGCSHFIVGRDHAGPGKDSAGNDFYGPYDAQQLMLKYEDEIGIKMVPFKMMGYVEETNSYQTVDEVAENHTLLNISGTELRNKLASGEEIPEWFSYPDIVDELRRSYPMKNKMGLTLFFTGLSGAGKSTIANALLVKLMAEGNRNVTLLDGDVVRQHLSSELGFSKEHRDLNILRIGYVASEITKHGGIAICAPIAPYRVTRKKVRELVSNNGRFVEIHVSTTLAVCEQRDTKGLYAKARAGLIKKFTGIDDPYEKPENAEIVIDTSLYTIEEEVDEIINWLSINGYT